MNPRPLDPQLPAGNHPACHHSRSAHTRAVHQHPPESSQVQGRCCTPVLYEPLPREIKLAVSSAPAALASPPTRRWPWSDRGRGRRRGRPRSRSGSPVVNLGGSTAPPCRRQYWPDLARSDPLHARPQPARQHRPIRTVQVRRDRWDRTLRPGRCGYWGNFPLVSGIYPRVPMLTQSELHQSDFKRRDIIRRHQGGAVHARQDRLTGRRGRWPWRSAWRG